MNLIHQLVSKWVDEGIDIRGGVDLEAIQIFENHHNVVLPADFRNYFTAVDGMGERHTSDNGFFGFWRFQDLVSISDDLPDRAKSFEHSHRYFLFADHSISLPAFAIRLSDDRAAPTPVARVFSDFGALDVEDFFDSFTDFVNVYLVEPARLLNAIPSPTIQRLNMSDETQNGAG